MDSDHYERAKQKLEQMEADGKDMNQLRDDIRGNLRSFGFNEDFFNRVAQSDPNMKIKIERRKEMMSELIPWLKENNIKFSEPTYAGILFISTDKKVDGKSITFSIEKETQNIYDIQTYHGLIGEQVGRSQKFTLEGMKRFLSE